MSILLQAFSWPDLIIALVLFLATLLFFIGVVGFVILSGKELSWRLLLLISATYCIPGFGLTLGMLYISYRFAGIPASMELLLISGDASGALVVIGFIGLAASLPFLHLALMYSGKISSLGGLHSHKIWFGLLQRLATSVLFITALAPAFLIVRSQLVPNVLFGTPEPYDCLRQSIHKSTSLDLVTTQDCPARFSVILQRLSSALGINRTAEFDILTTILTVATILQGVAAFFALYDRFRKRNQIQSQNEKTSPSTRL